VRQEMVIIDFIDKWTINFEILKKYKYVEYTKPFTVTIDKTICELLVSGINPKITSIMISKFKNNIINYIDSDNQLTVTHNNRYGMGRFYSNYDNSPVCHSKYLKHTIFKYQDWLDIDMVKGFNCSFLYL
jgi:hypothetical protein